MTPPSLWDLVELAAAADGAQALHLAVGKPPMIRIVGEGLRPLGDSLPTITSKGIMRMLSTVVDPESWDRIEQTGEGETVLSRGAGRPMRLVLFRNSEAWSVVVHL